ncbi:MAG: hypothetical protein HN509_09640, partial [Halobacteriovoraceae bacterium]|nr:hypothetical protein [Halobacteriovoraceae bacterium]
YHSHELDFATSTGSESAIWMSTSSLEFFSVQYSTTTSDVTVFYGSTSPVSGTMAVTSSTTFNSDSTFNALETPYDLSITGNETHIWVSYAIGELDFFATTTPLIRVRRLDRSTLGTVDIFDVNVVHGGIGDIFVNSTNWYLPYIDVNNSNSIAVVKATTTATTAGEVTVIGGVLNTEPYNGVHNAYDAVNDNIFIVAEHLGNVNVTGSSHGLLGTGIGVNTALDTNIFAGNTVTKIDVAGNITGNDFSYATGLNIAGDLMLWRGIGSAWGATNLAAPVDNTAGTINNVDQLEIITGEDGVTNEVYVVTAKGNEIYANRIVNDTTVHPSPAFVNATSSEVASPAAGLAVSAFRNDQQVFADGAVLNESIKDVMYIQWYDGNSCRVDFTNIDPTANNGGFSGKVSP